ncbi:LuxR family transcriptional regulator [Mucilaginibacter sp. JRF]|uniref:response regulator transcription factor n=1 Tax=Mucilaginibacter sp. JRF TaxID=2780088 RepID=UPI001880BFFC|nr:helix-turn-helix transcriptional regulator [Mucilaginibacter sp. JRF]MBE9586599.1 LuxR family transcriptional regulator [Mucilaginibacter sp. JRF]
MKNNTTPSYLDFLNRVKSYKSIDIATPGNILKSFPLVDISSLYPGAVFITDYVNNRYLYLAINSNKFLGYSDSFLLGEGPSFINSLLHPYDFKVYNEKIFPANIACLKKYADTDYKNLLFTVNCRLRDGKGKYCALRLCSSFISIADDGTPLLEISALSDISDYKSDVKIVHLIQKYNAQNKISLLNRKCYLPCVNQVLLTKREVDILRWVCEGFSSKQIADKLNISIYTINNHRKNMLRKSQCHNLTELLHNAVNEGLI